MYKLLTTYRACLKCCTLVRPSFRVLHENKVQTSQQSQKAMEMHVCCRTHLETANGPASTGPLQSLRPQHRHTPLPHWRSRAIVNKSLRTKRKQDATQHYMTLLRMKRQRYANLHYMTLRLVFFSLYFFRNLCSNFELSESMEPLWWVQSISAESGSSI